MRKPRPTELPNSALAPPPTLPFADMSPEVFADFLSRTRKSISLEEALKLRHLYRYCPPFEPHKEAIDNFFKSGNHPIYDLFPQNGLSAEDIIQYANLTGDPAGFSYAVRCYLSARELFRINRGSHLGFMALSDDPEYLTAVVSVIRDKTSGEELAYSRNKQVPQDARRAFVRSLRFEEAAMNIYYSWDSEIRSRFRLYSFTGKDTMLVGESPSAFDVVEEDRKLLAESFPVIKKIERLRHLRDSGQLDLILHPERIWSSEENLRKRGLLKGLAQFSGSMGAHFDLYDRREVARLGLDVLDMKLVADFFKPYPTVAKSWSNSKYDPKTGLAGIPLRDEIYNAQMGHHRH